MIAMSYSGMGDLECPFRFNAVKIEKTHKDPETPAMIVGNQTHEIISNYLRHCWTHGIGSDVEYFDGIILPKEPDREKLSGLIERFKTGPYAIIDLNAKWVNIEKKCELDADGQLIAFGPRWSNDQRVAFRGICDYAYVSGDTLHILDWKTGFGDPDDLQLKLYAYMFWLALIKEAYANSKSIQGIDRIACTFVILATGQNRTIEFTPTSCLDAKQIVADAVEKANSLHPPYEAIPCAKCKWCTVPGCPVRDGIETAVIRADGSPVLSIPDSIQSRDEAEKALLFVSFAESLSDRIKKLLRAFVEKNGPVIAGGKIAELRPNEPWNATDMEKLVNALVAYKVPREIIWDNLSLSESGLEKILKKAKMKERLPLLLALGERKKYSPKFGLYNDTL